MPEDELVLEEIGDSAPGEKYDPAPAPRSPGEIDDVGR